MRKGRFVLGWHSKVLVQEEGSVRSHSTVNTCWEETDMGTPPPVALPYDCRPCASKRELTVPSEPHVLSVAL